jgi:hypothetical protein
MRKLLLSASVLTALSAHAQQNTLDLGEIVGDPCRNTSFSTANPGGAPTPQTQYLRRLTRVTAVTVAGTGSARDNEVITACMQVARSRTEQARSSTHLRLYLDLYSEAFRACVNTPQRRMAVYEVSFRHEERCGTPAR